MTKSEAAKRIASLGDETVGEYVGSELVITPRPEEALRAAEVLALELGGESMRAGSFRFKLWPQLYLGGDILVPALAAWRGARAPADLDAPSFTVAPHWVAEVLSPDNARAVRAAKMPAYARETIEWAWLLDPHAHTVEVYRRMGDRWLVEQTIAGEAAIHAAPFGEIGVDLGALWPGEAGESPAP